MRHKHHNIQRHSRRKIAMPGRLTLKQLKGMTPAVQAKLKTQKIISSDQLLQAGASPKGRAELAKSTGSKERAILEMVNRADLARVKGVGTVYSNLLEIAGVDTVKELAQRKPDNLTATLADVNAKKKLTKQTPTLEQVKDWVGQAKALKKMVTY
jgi:predicted flap endonuclease-1-like 5' DNA nuclease